jgi:hypothetical protein
VGRRDPAAGSVTTRGVGRCRRARPVPSCVVPTAGWWSSRGWPGSGTGWPPSAGRGRRARRAGRRGGWPPRAPAGRSRSGRPGAAPSTGRSRVAQPGEVRDHELWPGDGLGAGRHPAPPLVRTTCRRRPRLPAGRGGHLPAPSVRAHSRHRHAEVGGHVARGPPLGASVRRALVTASMLPSAWMRSGPWLEAANFDVTRRGACQDSSTVGEATLRTARTRRRSDDEGGCVP